MPRENKGALCVSVVVAGVSADVAGLVNDLVTKTLRYGGEPTDPFLLANKISSCVSESGSHPVSLSCKKFDEKTKLR